MAPHFATCVARFRSPSGAVCGAGFLIDRRHVMTCAHVVNATLGLELAATERPDGLLLFDLPFANAKRLEAHVAEWHAPVPYEKLESGKPSDIAVLRLSVERPAGTIAARIASGRPHGEIRFVRSDFRLRTANPRMARRCRRMRAGGCISGRRRTTAI